MDGAGKTIAVTGSTGFIGRSVIRQLIERGYSVNALFRRATELDGIRSVQGDLDNKTALQSLASGADTFIHIAGLTKARTLKHLLQVNETGAANAAAAAEKAGIRRFILVSSIAAREPHLSHYAASKRAGEEAVKAQLGQTELIIIRPPAIIGPGDEATRPMLDILQRGYLPAPGGKARATSRMSFVYMDDIARFLVEAIERVKDRDILTPHGGTPSTSWQELADTAAEILDRPVKLLPIPRPILKGSALISQFTTAIFLKSSFFNTGKVRELLHNDWTGETAIVNARTLSEALTLAFELDRSV